MSMIEQICYFPSCNFTRLRPETSAKIKAFMASRGVRIMDCCRPGHKELRAGDTAVTICETCNIIVSENCPGVRCISLWEYLDGFDDIELPDLGGAAVTIQDCYRAKERNNSKTAARSLLYKMNAAVTELEGTEEERNFDGGWLFVPVTAANMKAAPHRFEEIAKDIRLRSPEETEDYLKDYCRHFKTPVVVCYCNSCLQGLEKGLPEDKKAVHLAELIFHQ